MIGFQPYETFQLLIDGGGAERPDTLLRAVADAFVRRGRPSPAELEQFTILASRLFPAASPEAREAAAATLGQSPFLSTELQHLVVQHAGGQLAAYLVAAPVLAEEVVLAVLDSASTTLGAALARRAGLTRPALDRLFAINSRRVYRALATNTAVPLTGTYLAALARSARMDHQVAWSLAARDDFDAALLAPVFFDLGEADRVKVIVAFSRRATPISPARRNIEQLSVPAGELTRALMKLLADNRRPEVTRLIHQITGLDEVRSGQIAHDTSGAALFVVLRAFGADAYEGLKVLIHAASHDDPRTDALASFSSLFATVTPDAMAFLISAWRGEVDLLELARPEYSPLTFRRPAREHPAPAVQPEEDAPQRRASAS